VIVGIDRIVSAIAQGRIRITDHADEFERCPLCGGELAIRQVEKILRGGGHTATMKVVAEVCQHCGERLYAEEVVRDFAEIREQLRRQEFSHFRSLGQSFTVVNGWPNKAIQPTV